VAVLLYLLILYTFGHYVKRLNLSAPTYFSSNSPHYPKTAGLKPFTVV
jgi:hypothetical protein